MKTMKLFLCILLVAVATQAQDTRPGVGCWQDGGMLYVWAGSAGCFVSADKGRTWHRLEATSTAHADAEPPCVRSGATIQVYPNPAVDWAVLRVEVSSPLRADILVRDVLGRSTVHAASVSLEEGQTTILLNLAHLPSGRYQYEVWSSGHCLGFVPGIVLTTAGGQP
jgi:hypothetical protein